VFALHVSFHVPEPGPDFQSRRPTGALQPRDGQESWVRRSGILAAFEIREVIRGADGQPRQPGDPARRFWGRVRGGLPEGQLVHALALAYLSDLGAVRAAYAPLPVPFGRGTFTSLDHALWLHRPVRMDEWVLFDFDPVSVAASRGLVHGSVYTQDGTLVASIAQEVLIRTGVVP
jgi:acyl-CoA thioesterase II